MAVAMRKKHERFVDSVDALSKQHGDEMKAEATRILKRAVALSKGSPLRFLSIVKSGKAEVVKRMTRFGMDGRNHARTVGRSFGMEKVMAKNGEL